MKRALIQALAPSTSGKFEISQITSLEDAQRAVRMRDVVAAYEPSVPPTLYFAGGVGSALNGAAQGLFHGIAAQQGHPLNLVDLVPLVSGDPSGTGIFYFVIICTLAGYLTMTVLEQAAPALPPLPRLGLLAGMSLFAPLAVYLIAGVGMGVFDPSFGQVIALIALGMIYTFGIGLVARALQLIFGKYAIYFMMTIFVFINFPSSGGAMPYELLPPVWRFFHQFWIGASLVNCLQSLLYFNNLHLWRHLAILIAWVVVWLIILSLPIHRMRRRVAASDLEIAAIPSPV